MRFFFKKIEVPATNETKLVDAVQTWAVRWESRHGEWHHDTSPEVEVFADEQLANDFAQSLRAAFKLVKHTSGNHVSVKKYE